MIRRAILAALSPIVVAVPALGQTAMVSASAVWARATPPGAATAVVYLTLTSRQQDRLTGVTTPAAAIAGVHQDVTDHGIMRMRPIPGGLDLPAGQTVVLRPGGDHIMLDGLKTPLVAGQTLSLHLTFAHAPPLDVSARVQPIGASMPDMAMGH